MAVVYSHKVGDSLHYITGNARSFPDGSSQVGDTSDLCILLNLETVLAHNGLNMSVPDLWNQAYPDDFMSEEDFAMMLGVSIHASDPFDPTAPDNISAALDDVRAMGCPELADLVEALLRRQGGTV
jgi:hypothetical protein